MAAKPLWDPNDDRPEASTRCDKIKSRNTAVPRSFNLHTDTVMQQSYVTSRKYHGVKLFSATSKLPDFSGSEGEPQEFEDIMKPEAEIKMLPQGQTQSTDLHAAQFGSWRKPRILRKQKPRPPRDGTFEGLKAQPEMLLQPDTRPISHEQLVVEVKGIYAGLVMVEAKCIDIDERQSAAAQEKDPSKRTDLKNDQWQSLIALHKQLLHEHHDFFLASQHPSASPALSRLAAKYSMPARMWRHGIHAFLEVLRHRLPQSLEHMLAFIYIAYSMMALLYETVSTFEETWIECLGDLGRYRMAIEDDEPKDREVWSNVARFRYNKAANKSPNIGRLYHHLTILTPPFTLEQLSLYTRSLTHVTPFESVKGSIITLFNPIVNSRESTVRWSSSLEATFIRAHAIIFKRDLVDASYQFERTVAMFRQIGVFAAVANAAALFEFGKAKSRLLTLINTRLSDSAFPKPTENFIGRLPKEFLMRGSLYSQWYFPGTWFTVTTVGDHERSLEVPSISQPWIDRLLWLGRSFSSVCLLLPINELLLINA